MSEITPEKTHQLLEKLADYVMTEVSTKAEMNQKITQVDEKIDRLADYVMNNLPTREEIDLKLEKKADKNGVEKLLEGQDKIVKELEIIRTEQASFNHAIERIENRVENLEKVH